jgi:hypothetical protein
MFADRIGYGLIRLLAEIQKHIVEDEKLIREAFKEHPDAELFRDASQGLELQVAKIGDEFTA